MNFYKHHLGDYDSATAHLTWDEDMAYSRLMRVYYREEKPIPLELAKACRLVRAQTRTQKAAVEMVLEEFFKKKDDGWHNKRADEEIVLALEIGGEAEERRENEKERQRRHREERKKLFATLRSVDVVLPFDTSTEVLRSRVTALNGHEHVTDSSRVTGGRRTEKATAIQTPDSTIQTPLANSHKDSETERSRAKRSTPATRIPADFTLTEDRRSYAVQHGVDADHTFAMFTTYWRAKSGAGATKIDWDATWQHWCLKDQKSSRPKKTRFEEIQDMRRANQE